MLHIYLDHAATTPLDPRVRAAMEPYVEEVFGNASSVHWHGRQAKAALEQARTTIAGVIGAHPSEVFFTSGGTEGDNLAIQGWVAHRAAAHVVTASAEHHAVLDTCEHLRSSGVQVTVVPVDSAGTVDAAALDQALAGGAGLISIMHANNEVGTVQPIRAIADRAANYGAVVHTDAVQSIGKIPVNVDEL